MTRHCAPSEYVHGTAPEEQERLSQLNEFLNNRCLNELGLKPGLRVLDVGSGLGQMTCAMAEAVGPEGGVVGIERSVEQRTRAERYAHESGSRVTFREGDALALPLQEEELASFDVVHSRFVLEHLRDPQAAVDQMVRAVKPGGRIVLADDDHDLLRFDPPLPAIDHLWRAYIRLYDRLGNDPFIGRRLVRLLHTAGLRPTRNTAVFFGSCAGSPTFEFIAANFKGVLVGSRQPLLDHDLTTEAAFEDGMKELEHWRAREDAALWYTLCWAEAVL
ncbi:MAG: methyltransferase domain-containing protein [Planctomycetota bacterium]